MTLIVYDHLEKKDVLHRHTAHIISITAAITLGDEEVVLCDATGGAFSVTLPPVALHGGRTYRIIKTDNSVNAVTVDGNSSETINGATTQSLASQYDAITIIAEGTEWFMFSSNL